MWAFTSVYEANWHPITWLSHMIDAQVYGMNPRGHHFTSVTIHVFSSVLLLLLFVRITGSLWQSSFVAALFALHPLHVESVAWIAERKDVLSTFFGFITLLFYAEYVAKRKASLYILALISFVCGLMSKPMLVTFPIVMLLMDYWPLDRYWHEAQKQEQNQLLTCVITLLQEKIPFFVCSFLSGIITIYAQNLGGALRSLKAIPFGDRIKNVLIAYLEYIIKTFWPHKLAVLYPFPLTFPIWEVAGSLLILIIVTVITIKARNRHPYLVLGWLWFLVTLLPVIGLIQVGIQSMADRYTYIPLIGLFIMAAWGAPELTKSLQRRKSILALIAGTVIIASTILTWQQLGYWRDSISLYRHTLQVTTGNSTIHYNLGAALAEKNQLDSAIHEYQEAIRIEPDSMDVRINLGVAFGEKGLLDSAIYEFREALRINPDSTDAHYNLGLALAVKGLLDDAILEYQKALINNPSNVKAYDGLSIASEQKRQQNGKKLDKPEPHK